MACSCFILRCTIGCVYIRLFIAGAINTGLSNAKNRVDRASSAIPQANLPIILAVAGATSNISPQSACDMCLGLKSDIGSNTSEYTLLRETVCNVTVVTNSKALSVAMTLTSACSAISCRISSGHLYAAMPPEIPSKIFVFILFLLLAFYLYIFGKNPLPFFHPIGVDRKIGSVRQYLAVDDLHRR